MRAAVVLLALLLAACNTTPPEPPAVVTVEKKIKEPCIDKAPVRPVYQYGKGAQPTEVEMGAILIADFEKADQYGKAWEAASIGCIATPDPKAP